MSNSTTNLDLISVSQANKEIIVNALFDAASPAMLYGRRAWSTAGLTWGYYGGTVSVSGTPTQIANGTVTLTASATNYVEADPATGAVSVNQSAFTSGHTPLYTVVTGASMVTSYTDQRVLGGGNSGTVKSVNSKTPDTAGNVVLAASDVGADASGAASSAVSAHVAASDPHTQYLTQARGDARYPLASTEGQANGIATLGTDGKLTAAQLPDLAIIDFLGTVASQAAMLALTGQKGDWCIRSDDGKVYTITGSNPTQAASWTPMSYPVGNGGTVTSVSFTTSGLLHTVSGSPITGAGTISLDLKTQSANRFLAGPASGADAAPTMRAIVPADLPVMVASGASHAAGIVPDPGSTAGTVKYLREDGTWQVPPGTSTVTGSGSSSGTADTIPSLTGFSWAVQNGAVASQQSFGISIKKAAGPAQSSLIAPVSGSTWTATARLRSTLPNNGNYGIGLCRYDSASGKLVGFLYILGSTYTLQLLNYSTPTTFSSTVSNGYSTIQILEWMRIRSDGTNIYYELSSDGYSWSTIYTTAISGGYLPATTGCGIFMATSANVNDPALVASVHSWQVA